MAEGPPRIPASASALVADGVGRVLVVKPTYKSGWTLPGGQVEADGETPWEACRREVAEETGLDVTGGTLACVDFLRPHAGRPGGVRFLFDCGALGDEALASVTLPPDELAEARLVPLDDALGMLRGAVARRVAAARAATTTVYLEEGLPVAAVAVRA